jgi:hypothetical protein
MNHREQDQLVRDLKAWANLLEGFKRAGRDADAEDMEDRIALDEARLEELE